MFKFLSKKEQLRLEQIENEKLKAKNKMLEDALLELAEVVTEEEGQKNG